MLRFTSKLLCDNKKYILNVLEYQIIGINIEMHKSNCDIEKYLLLQERNKLNNIKTKIHLNQLSYFEMNELSNKYNNFQFNKKIDLNIY